MVFADLWKINGKFFRYLLKKRLNSLFPGDQQELTEKISAKRRNNGHFAGITEKISVK
jgi:hypothetical protein